MGKILVLVALGLGLWLLVRILGTPRDVMDRRTAARLLGIAPDAGPDTIRTAHRRLIERVHPDKGGNEELARTINRARDVLLDAKGGSRK